MSLKIRTLDELWTSNIKNKIEVSLKLYEEGIIKNNICKHPNFKYILNNDDLYEGLNKLNYMMKNCKFNDTDENGTFIDPIFYEPITSNFIDIEGRFYNKNTLVQIILNEKEPKDPFTRKPLSKNIIDLFSGKIFIKTLIHNNENLTNFPLLYEYKNLTNLNLKNNFIKSIPIGLSEILIKIKTLNLENNLIEKINKDFSNFKNLKILNLNGNKINIINNLPISITVLSIDSNNISKFPLHLNKNIQSISLENNEIEFIPNINKYKFLNNLNLKNNKINKIIKIPTSIQTLDLTNNNLNKFFLKSTYINLQILILKNNKINNINKIISSNLICLDISKNKLKKMPNFSSIYNLKILDISSNLIDKIDESKLTISIEHLFMKNNNIKYIPKLDNFYNLGEISS